LMKKQGYYSWAAAIRQSYELVRKEFLEPNPRGPAAPLEEPGGRESIS